MEMFVTITKKRQELYEKLYTDNSELNNNVPCICGLYGRACRQMNNKADRRLCSECSLRIFISTVEAILEVCNEKGKIGVYLYDSDILDIQSRLKESVIDVEYSYIEKIIEHLVAENNTEQ